MLQLSSPGSLSDAVLSRAPSRTRWRKFGVNAPTRYETVEIRRLHDDKTILRRRVDLPPSFDWRNSEWRPL